MFSEAVGLLEQVGFKAIPKLSSTYQWWSWAASEFQTTGAATVKLHRLSFVVLVLGTNKSPRSAKQRARSSNIQHWYANIFEVGRASTTDTVERENSDLELNSLRYWQPVENVAKSWRDVVVLASADNETLWRCAPLWGELWLLHSADNWNG